MSGRTVLVCMSAWLFATTASAVSKDACITCHAADEFKDFSSAEIADALKDTSILPHRDAAAALSDEEIRSIAEELAGS